MATITASTASKQDTSGTATQLATDSMTVPAGAVALLYVQNIKTGFSTPETPTVSGWTQIDTRVDITLVPLRVTIFRRVGPFSGVQTADFGGATQFNCSLMGVQASGVKVSGTNGADAFRQAVYANGNGTSVLSTLSALLRATHEVIGVFQLFDSARTLAAGSGLTELTNVANAGIIEWGSNDLTLDGAITGGSSDWGGWAIEVVDTPIPLIHHHRQRNF